MEFDKVSPKEFLASCDIFVYFPHSKWVESFGRVIIEAMAVGLPVILPHMFKPLFGEAAIYATPTEVTARVNELMSTLGAYEAQVALATTFLERQFSYAHHHRRVTALLS